MAEPRAQPALRRLLSSVFGVRRLPEEDGRAPTPPAHRRSHFCRRNPHLQLPEPHPDM